MQALFSDEDVERRQDVHLVLWSLAKKGAASSVEGCLGALQLEHAFFGVSHPCLPPPPFIYPSRSLQHHDHFLDTSNTLHDYNPPSWRLQTPRNVFGWLRTR